MKHSNEKRIMNECYFRMLVTGDFCYDEEMKKHLKELRLHTVGRKIDLLHCDDTCFEKPNYWTDSLVFFKEYCDA